VLTLEYSDGLGACFFLPLLRVDASRDVSPQCQSEVLTHRDVISAELSAVVFVRLGQRPAGKVSSRSLKQ
jgi:hypothetical protein